MASKNEKIKDALKVLRVYPKAEASDGSGLVVLNNMAIADRIEAAAKRFYDKYKEHTDELNRKILVLKREKEMSDTYFCGYDPEEALDCAWCEREYGEKQCA